MNMKNANEYHGFLTLPRQCKLLLQELGYDLFGFYIGLVMCAVWYRDNKDIGRILKTQTEIAESLHMTQETVSRKFKALESHRYFVIRHKRVVILGFFPLFLQDVNRKIHSKDYANLNELYADMYKINAELQDNYTVSQNTRTQNNSQRLYSSSKDNYSLSSVNDEINPINVQEIIKEGGVNE